MPILNTEIDLERKKPLQSKQGWTIPFTVDTYRSIIEDLSNINFTAESDPLFTNSPAFNVIDSGPGTNFLADDGTYKPVVGGGGETLAQTLSLGNVTGGTNIDLQTDSLQFNGGDAYMVWDDNIADYVGMISDGDGFLFGDSVGVPLGRGVELAGSGGVIMKTTNPAITWEPFGGSFSSTLSSATLTASRSIDLPDASGTLALTSDLSTYLLLSGGTMTGTITSGAFKALEVQSDGWIALNGIADTAGLWYKSLGSEFEIYNSVASGVINLNAADGSVKLSVDNFRSYNFTDTRMSIAQDADVQFSTVGGFTGTLAGATTGNRTWTLPDSTGTLALLSDIISSAGTQDQFQVTDNAGDFVASPFQLSGNTFQPVTTLIGNLGSTTNRWNELQINGIIGFGNSSLLIKDSTNSTTIGITAGDLLLYGGRDLRFVSTASVIEWDGSQSMISAPAQDKLRLESGNAQMNFGNTLEGGGIGIDQNAQTDALLALTSTSQGFSPPRMTGAQVEAIGSPTEGLMAYATSAGAGDVTAAGWWGYNGTNWVQLG